jgi:membrane-associated phospholipid phosphatase
VENILETGLEVIRWMQENYPQLEGFFAAISFAGQEEFFLAILPLIYWCVNKRVGKLMGYVLFIAIGINTILKQGFRSPRPFWLDPALGLKATGGYGIPSGHTQYATSLYFLLAAAIGGIWVWLVAGLLVVLMAVSRVYLGQHFIHDVLAGFFVGLVLLLVTLVMDRQFSARLSKRILGQRMLLALAVVVVLAAAYVGMLLLIGEPDLSVPWAAYIPDAELASKNEMATAIGALLGFSIGALLEGSRVRFRADGPLIKRVARYVLGIVITVVIWQGLGIVFPREPLAIAIPLRIFRYFLVTIWAVYYAPWVFVKLRLADADPPPQLSLRFDQN